jgi:peptidoglycan hydrolase-like protein with peptidoglycan-binding domain
MNYNWAPFTDAVDDKGFGGTRSGAPINGIVIHHGAGTNVLGYVANANPRSSHPTYHIGNDGKLTGVVHPSRRPFSTAHNVDASSITVEIDNSAVGGQWPISDAAMDTLVRLIAWQETVSPRTGVALNNPSVAQGEFFVAWHQQYSATACPGPHILNRLGQIVDRARATQPEAATPAPAPARPVTPAPPAPPIPAGRPVLRRGARGVHVRDAQRRLIAHGFTVGRWGADGDFGNATHEATVRFQRSRRLVVDGIIGGNTWAELVKAPSRAGSPQATKRPVVQRGSTGKNVRDLQSRLNRDYPSYSKLSIDGIFGPATERVVVEFQRRAGIVVDGIVGPQTWAALGL